jgi:urease accessory protein UreH
MATLDSSFSEKGMEHPLDLMGFEHVKTGRHATNEAFALERGACRMGTYANGRSTLL